MPCTCFKRLSDVTFTVIGARDWLVAFFFPDAVRGRVPGGEVPWRRHWTSRLPSPQVNKKRFLFSWTPPTVLWCFVHVCFVQVTILKLVWSSRRVDAPGCAHFPTDICSLIQEGVISVEKCASAHRERHTLSLGRNKHGHYNSALTFHMIPFCISLVYILDIMEVSVLHFMGVHCTFYTSYMYIYIYILSKYRKVFF